MGERDFLTRGGLAPSVSWAMTRLAGISAHSTILDPCVGRGGLLVEAALLQVLLWGSHVQTHACVHVCMCACVHVCMCACVHAGMFTAYTGQETCKCLGVDADAEQLSIARAAALAAGCAGRVEVVHGDCTCLPLRQHSVDVTLVDLPFGKRHKSPLGIKALYSQVCLCVRARGAFERERGGRGWGLGGRVRREERGKRDGDCVCLCVCARPSVLTWLGINTLRAGASRGVPRHPCRRGSSSSHEQKDHS